MINGMEKKTTVPTTTSPVYIAGLPTGSWEGGKNVTAKENSTARNPIPAMSHIPRLPPGTR